MRNDLKDAFEHRYKKRQKRHSFIMTRINRFVSYIYSLVLYCFVGRSASSGDDFFSKSKIGYFLIHYKKSNNESAVSRRITFNKAVFENGGVRLLRATGRFFATLSVNVYGFFFAMYGIASIVVYYLKLFLDLGGRLGESSLLTSIIIVLCSIPFAVTSQSVVEMISRGKLAHKIFIEYLGISDELLTSSSEKHGGSVYLLLSTILGLMTGASAFVLHPQYIVIVFVTIIVFLIILYNPESGIMLTIPTVPFLKYTAHTKDILLLLTAVTMISYFIKYLKRQRRWHYSAEGLVLGIFGLFLIFVSLFSQVGLKSFLDAISMVTIILGGYYLTLNLMRNEKMIDRAISALCFSMVIICLIAVWNTGYDAVTDIMVRNLNENVGHIVKQLTLSVADNSEIFGIFAVAVMPLFFAACFKRKSVSSTVFNFILFILVFVCALFFGSYEAAIVMMVGIIMYIIMHSHKTLTCVGIFAIPVATLLLIYPIISQKYGLPNLIYYVQSIFPRMEISSSYTKELTSNVWNMISHGNFFGIGVGKEAFIQAFHTFSNSVSSFATDAGNLWLQIICWSGIPGMLTFVSFLLLQFRSSVGYMIRSTNYVLRHKVSAVFCGFTSILLLGNAYFIWNDVRMMYIFWLLAGLMAAYIRLGNAEESRNSAFCKNEDAITDVSIKMGF